MVAAAAGSRRSPRRHRTVLSAQNAQRGQRIRGSKTWLAISTAYHELQQGNSVLYIDFEDDENGIVGRLLTFHTPHEWIRERFHYKRPTQSVNTDQPRRPVRDCRATQPDTRGDRRPDRADNDAAAGQFSSPSTTATTTETAPVTVAAGRRSAAGCLAPHKTPAQRVGAGASFPPSSTPARGAV